MQKRIEKYVKEWESRCYTDGIPDEAPSEIKDKVPSYKQICIAILNNDYALKSLGLSMPTSPYYTELKKIELRERYKDNPEKLKEIDNYKKKSR